MIRNRVGHASENKVGDESFLQRNFVEGDKKGNHNVKYVIRSVLVHKRYVVELGVNFPLNHLKKIGFHVGKIFQSEMKPGNFGECWNSIW